MKVILILMFVISFNGVRAEEIFLPLGQPSLYVGSFSDVEKDLKDRILEVAKEKCGDLDNANIGKTHLSLRLGNVLIHSSMRDGDRIEGSYPVSGARFTLNCLREL